MNRPHLRRLILLRAAFMAAFEPDPDTATRILDSAEQAVNELLPE